MTSIYLTILFSAYIYAAICISVRVCVCMCVCACSMYSRTITLFELMFLLTKPTLNKVYFTLLYFILLYFTFLPRGKNGLGRIPVESWSTLMIYGSPRLNYD